MGRNSLSARALPRGAATEPGRRTAAAGGCPLAGLALLLALLVSAAAEAQRNPGSPPLNPDHPQSYRVRPGDTLWGIAGRFLRDPWRWPEIWESNPGVRNPNRIYPGDVLELSYAADGSPRVRTVRGGMRVVKLTPRVRVTELDRSIPTIPASAVAPFLSRPLVADSRVIDQAPYVVGFPEGHIMAAVGDTFFVRSIFDDREDRFEVLRPGQAYRDPDTNEPLGFEAAFVAEARLKRLGDPATLVVTQSNVEVLVGDRTRPARDERAVRNFLPRPAPPGVEGKIAAVLGGVSQIGQYDVVVLNRGSDAGVEIGHVFEVYSGGDQRPDPVRNRRADWNWRNETPLDTSFWYGDWQVTGWERDWPSSKAPLPLHRRAERLDSTFIAPDSRAGIVMVFRVFSRVSFALVMRATKAMHVGEIVSTPREV